MSTIAVVIPLFNGAKFIAEALASVGRQTRRPDQIVVVDDGSTDDGAKIVGAWQALLFRQDNRGQSSARNNGVAASSADFIALLDQDDIWHPRHLEELERVLEADPKLGWVYGNADTVDLDGKLIQRAYQTGRKEAHPKREPAHYAGQDMHVLPSTTLIRRRAFEEVGGFDEKLSGCEDDDLFGRLMRAGWGNAYLTEPLTAWRLHPGSSGHSPRMLDSRAYYGRKLLEGHLRGTPEEQRLAAGTIAPRFRNALRIDIRNAVRRHDNLAIAEAIERYGFLPMTGTQRAIVEMARDWRLALVSGRLMKWAFARPGAPHLPGRL